MFNKVDKKRFIILVVAVVVCAAALVGTRMTGSHQQPVVSLAQKVDVFDDAQFTLKPMHHPQLNLVKVLVDITSYMDPELLTIDYQTVSMLEQSDRVVMASDFETLDSSDHSLTGYLFFYDSQFNASDPFLIKIFTYSDNEMAWN